MIHVFSIDDSKAVHAFLSSVLEPASCRMSHAYDGAEGLSMLEAKKVDQVDLILLDWEMPKLTGIQTLEKIRSMGIKTPIIMLTSKNSPDEIMQALTLGANEYMMKPFTADILIEKIETVLARKLG